MSATRKATIAKAKRLGIELASTDPRSGSVCVVAENTENHGKRHIRFLRTWREAEAFVDGFMYSQEWPLRAVKS